MVERDEAINAVSGAVAGLVTAVFVCPLDVLKTRLQASATALADLAAIPIQTYKQLWVYARAHERVMDAHKRRPSRQFFRLLSCPARSPRRAASPSRVASNPS